MREYTWYGRLAVWIGVVIMLLQAVTGRGTNVMTLVAVVGVTGGFLAFLAGLVTDRDQRARAPDRVIAAQDAAYGTGATPTAEANAAVPSARATGMGDTASITTHAPAEPRHAANVAVPSDEPVSNQAAETIPDPGRVQTVEVTRSSGQVGATCPVCSARIRAGHVAATCYVCGSVHHAACWMENHFHCGQAGCTGHGSLEAPTSTDE